MGITDYKKSSKCVIRFLWRFHEGKILLRVHESNGKFFTLRLKIRTVLHRYTFPLNSDSHLQKKHLSCLQDGAINTSCYFRELNVQSPAVGMGAF